LIRDRYTPLLDGRKPLPVIGYSSWYSVFNAFNEKSLRALADVAADLEQEVFEVDSGWFAGTRMGPTNGEWQWGVGNWEKVDPIRFPNGMRPLVDYVHSKGMKFGLWIEPERANRESLLGKAHAEWLIWPPGPRNLKNDREWALVDFGLKEAQDWWIEFLCRYIREYSIRYLRWDLNFTPADTWAAHDKAGRRGITQIRHVEGLHRVMREVLRRNPGTLIENCAGGGGRVDLQSMEHAHAFWLTNHSSDPHVVRHYLGGANHIVPTAYSIVAFELPVWWKKSFEFPDILFQSYFGGAFGISTNIAEWPPAMRAQAKKHVQAYKKIRKYLVEDYYRLLPAPADLEAWEAWQFHDPKNGDGFVQAFRTGSPEASRAIWLQALDARKTYRFTDVYTGASFQAPGAKAVNFELPAMSSKVLVYEPVPGR
jgi:alpha-galactosidase